MGWLRRAAVPDASLPDDALVGLLAQLVASRVGRVSRDVAVTVPAFTRALDLVKGTISGLPLRQYRTDLTSGVEQRVESRSWLDQPNDRITRQALVAATVDDLVCHGHAWWHVRAVDVTGRPANVALLPHVDVTEQPRNVPVDPDRRQVPIWYQDREIAPGRYIRFDSPFDGVLDVGGEVLTTAAALITAVRRGAEAPAPTIILKNTGADLPPDKVRELTDAWRDARQNGAVGYLSSVLDVVQSGYSNRDQELTAALNDAALQIARLMNVDAWWLGAAVAGSSLTYQNRQEAIRSLVELACGPYMKAIGERLSLDDVTPHGRVVRFDVSDLLRDNPPQAAGVVTQLLPAGVIDVSEARQLMGLPTVTKEGTDAWMSAPSPTSGAPNPSTVTAPAG